MRHTAFSYSTQHLPEQHSDPTKTRIYFLFLCWNLRDVSNLKHERVSPIHDRAIYPMLPQVGCRDKKYTRSKIDRVDSWKYMDWYDSIFLKDCVELKWFGNYRLLVSSSFVKNIACIKWIVVYSANRIFSSIVSFAFISLYDVFNVSILCDIKIFRIYHRKNQIKKNLGTFKICIFCMRSYLRI